MTTTVQQRQALRLLADAHHGRTVADLLAHGFTNALLDRLARDGLATIQPGTMRAGTRRITVVCCWRSGSAVMANGSLEL
jgi:hypothetical protein